MINYVKSKLQQFYLIKDFGVVDEILVCKVCVDKHLDCITIQQAQSRKEIINNFLPADDTVTYLVPADPALHLSQSQCAISVEDRLFLRILVLYIGLLS